MRDGEVRGVETKSRKGNVRRHLVIKGPNGFACFSTSIFGRADLTTIRPDPQLPYVSSIIRHLNRDEIEALKVAVAEREQSEVRKLERARLQELVDARNREAQLRTREEERKAHGEQARVGSLLAALDGIPPETPLVIAAISSHYRGHESWNSFLVGIEKIDPDCVRFATLEQLRCRGHLRNGRPCCNAARADSFYCGIHEPVPTPSFETIGERLARTSSRPPAAAEGSASPAELRVQP